LKTKLQPFPTGEERGEKENETKPRSSIRAEENDIKGKIRKNNNNNNPLFKEIHKQTLTYNK